MIGTSEARNRFANAEYVGFDYYRGPNVDVVGVDMFNPIIGCFSLADEYLRFRRVPLLYCHSEFLGHKISEVNDFSWSNLDLEQVVGATKYPSP